MEECGTKRPSQMWASLLNGKKSTFDQFRQMIACCRRGYSSHPGQLACGKRSTIKQHGQSSCTAWLPEESGYSSDVWFDPHRFV
jgi:hypothetical protein